MGAWWELYTAGLFRHLGYDVVSHPTIEGSKGKPSVLRDLVIGSGLEFGDRGAHTLRVCPASGVCSPPLLPEDDCRNNCAAMHLATLKLLIP
jgi:hypothetical protein